MKKKYPLHKELASLAKMKPPVCKTLLPMMNMAKQRGLPVPRAELLIYPVTDRRMETESMKKYMDTPMWNARLNAKMWELYLGTQTLGNMAYASPAEVQSLEGFPASYIEVAEYDCLKDEGIAFGNRLKEEKVPVELHEVKQACHGFETAINSSVTKEVINRRVDFLKRVR